MIRTYLYMFLFSQVVILDEG